MKIIDRYVASRFLVNFVLLGAALYVFGVSVDVVIQASRFLDAADTAVAAGRYGSRVIAFSPRSWLPASNSGAWPTC